MARRRSRGRSSGAKGANYVWTAVLPGFGLITAGDESLIVAKTDWSNIVGFERATIMTVRGWLSFTSGGTAAADYKWAIVLVDEDVPIQSSLLADFYTDEDILWTGGGRKALTDAGDNSWQINHDVNVKAKRKMTSGQELRIIFDVTATSSIHVVGVLRALLKKNNG